MQDATLVFLTRDNQILLGLKKRGFAQGKLNGFGGKIEAGETIP
ncbi:MAG: DNA mismatch repair protein MutT, partial [Chloroflexota bacterium]